VALEQQKELEWIAGQVVILSLFALMVGVDSLIGRVILSPARFARRAMSERGWRVPA